MACSWRKVAIGELAEIFDGPHATPAKTSKGPVFLGISNLAQGRLDLAKTEYLSEDDYQRWTRRVEPKAGDLVFSYETRLGEAAIIPPGLRCCLGRRMGLLRVRSGEVDKRFLLYAYLGPQFQEVLRSRTIHGSTVDRIPLADMPGFLIRIPDTVDEQRAIAGVLGALDDKIEQNIRTARALDRLARAIFHAWFVDFEPVKAKAAGAIAFPSMPQPVFDALPTRFVDSVIGPVPEEWAVQEIGDVVTLKGGGTPSTQNPEYWDRGEHCWATPKDMSRLAHPVLLDTERRITVAGVNSISSGILPVGTVLMSSRAPVGYLAIAGVPTAINQGFIALVCDGPLPSTYVLNWAFGSMDVIKAHASGTTFPEISKKSFRPLPVVQPTGDVIAAYQQTADPLFASLTAAVREGEQLATVRDYLLPQLLSGSVRVRP